jgi:hypothetical protein
MGAVGLKLAVSYGSAGGLLLDFEQQLRMGGLFAQLEVGAELPPFAALTVSLRVAGAAAIEAPARVTAVTADTVCVEILPEARSELAQRIASQCAGVAATPDRTGVRLVREQPPAAPCAAIALDRKIAAMSIHEKVQLALHGNRDERILLMRDRAGLVQSSLVRNSKTSLDEITAIARAPHLSPDTAEVLANHPTHGESAQVAAALVRNPRTPIPTAIGLIAKLSPADLRAIAKGLNVRMQISGAARKRLLNG